MASDGRPKAGTPDDQPQQQLQHSSSASALPIFQKPLQLIVDFLRKHTTYDMIPDSAKVVVLDTDLPIKNAFYALVEHDMNCAVLWDSRLQDYVGMLTVTDFMDILRYMYKSPSGNSFAEDLEEQQIRRWREMTCPDRPSGLISIDPEDSIYEACRRLRVYRIHRLPILERQNHHVILHIITHSRVLGYLVRNLRGFPEILERTLEELKIGTYENLCTVRRDAAVMDVLTLLSERRISAVPIVDDNGVVVDVYSRSDVTCAWALMQVLARERNHASPEVTVSQALAHRHRAFHSVQICRKTDTLKVVFERLALSNVHRLVVVDDKRRVDGIVSVSDIFAYFVT